MVLEDTGDTHLTGKTSSRNSEELLGREQSTLSMYSPPHKGDQTLWAQRMLALSILSRVFIWAGKRIEAKSKPKIERTILPSVCSIFTVPLYLYTFLRKAIFLSHSVRTVPLSEAERSSSSPAGFEGQASLRSNLL